MKELFSIKMEIFIIDGCFDDFELNVLYKSLIIYSVLQKPLGRNEYYLMLC